MEDYVQKSSERREKVERQQWKGQTAEKEDMRVLRGADEEHT